MCGRALCSGSTLLFFYLCSGTGLSVWIPDTAAPSSSSTASCWRRDVHSALFLKTREAEWTGNNTHWEWMRKEHKCGELNRAQGTGNAVKRWVQHNALQDPRSSTGLGGELDVSSSHSGGGGEDTAHTGPKSLSLHTHYKERTSNLFLIIKHNEITDCIIRLLWKTNVKDEWPCVSDWNLFSYVIEWDPCCLWS